MPTPYAVIGNHTLYLNDNLEVLKEMPDNSVDSIVADPPYALTDITFEKTVEALKCWLNGEVYYPKGSGFMGKQWDAWVPGPELWKECYRVLKPGGHMFIFSAPRTVDLMNLAIRLGGFEIRDVFGWVFGSGFPKSLDVSKAIDKAAGADREVLATRPAGSGPLKNGHASRGGGGGFICEERSPELKITAPATPEAEEWSGWGTAVKPAYEPITLARKPLEGTVAANVLKWGTGAINVDGCRVDKQDGDRTYYGVNGIKRKTGNVWGKQYGEIEFDGTQGRFPANLIHDGSEEVLNAFPNAPGQQRPTGPQYQRQTANTYGKIAKVVEHLPRLDSGSAARFFYCAKASKEDREEGLRAYADRILAMSNQAKAELAKGNMHVGESGMNTAKLRKNNHPTVKPTILIQYLQRMITPPGGTTLDMFIGSGTAGKAAEREGFSCIGIDDDENSIHISIGRIEYEVSKGRQTSLF